MSVIVESHVEEIVSFLTNKGEATTAEIAETIGLKPSRTRELLGVIDEVEAIGSNKDRCYFFDFSQRLSRLRWIEAGSKWLVAYLRDSVFLGCFLLNYGNH